MNPPLSKSDAARAFNAICDEVDWQASRED